MDNQTILLLLVEKKSSPTQEENTFLFVFAFWYRFYFNFFLSLSLFFVSSIQRSDGSFDVGATYAITVWNIPRPNYGAANATRCGQCFGSIFGKGSTAFANVWAHTLHRLADATSVPASKLWWFQSEFVAATDSERFHEQQFNGGTTDDPFAGLNVN
jgi:hypothetical protein